MNTSTIEQTLLEERKYWQGVADYMLESASMDVNSNLTFDQAQKKTDSIDRALKRIKAGVYGRCEKCNAQIDPERLKTLASSDCHLCVRCAETAKARKPFQPVRRKPQPTYRHTVFAFEPA
jgi:RNA polymerase-binding transcription factor DksA